MGSLRVCGFSVISRRRLLTAGLSFGGALVIGGGALWRLRGEAPAVAGLRCLTTHEYRTLSALATALFPNGGAIAPGAREMDLPRTFDAFLADEPARIRLDLKRALLLLEYGPVLFERRGSTFSHLSERDRLEHFTRWAESDSLLRRQIATAFRRFLSLVFYDRFEVWPALGYEGPLIGEVAE